MASFSVLFDRLRWEEKEILHSLQKIGQKAELVDVKSISFSLDSKEDFTLSDNVFVRCLSHYRSWLSAEILRAKGKHVINRPEVISVCMNKLLTTIALVKEGVPTPKTYVSFSSDSAEEIKEKVGLPLVIKPLVGSWGRLISLARDNSSFRSIIELREAINDPLEHIYYFQEFVRRPPRDIRAIVAGEEIVACVYRYSPPGEWKTNVARGGFSVQFNPSEALQELIHRSADAVGGGLLGVDLMESESGYLVHELNCNVEFRGAQSAVNFSIADKVANYLVREARK